MLTGVIYKASKNDLYGEFDMRIATSTSYNPFVRDLIYQDIPLLDDGFDADDDIKFSSIHSM